MEAVDVAETSSPCFEERRPCERTIGHAKQVYDWKIWSTILEIGLYIPEYCTSSRSSYHGKHLSPFCSPSRSYRYPASITYLNRKVYAYFATGLWPDWMTSWTPGDRTALHAQRNAHVAGATSRIAHVLPRLMSYTAHWSLHRSSPSVVRAPAFRRQPERPRNSIHERREHVGRIEERWSGFPKELHFGLRRASFLCFWRLGKILHTVGGEMRMLSIRGVARYASYRERMEDGLDGFRAIGLRLISALTLRFLESVRGAVSALRSSFLSDGVVIKFVPEMCRNSWYPGYL